MLVKIYQFIAFLYQMVVINLLMIISNFPLVLFVLLFDMKGIYQYPWLFCLTLVLFGPSLGANLKVLHQIIIVKERPKIVKAYCSAYFKVFNQLLFNTSWLAVLGSILTLGSYLLTLTHLPFSIIIIWQLLLNTLNLGIIILFPYITFISTFFDGKFRNIMYNSLCIMFKQKLKVFIPSIYLVIMFSLVPMSSLFLVLFIGSGYGLIFLSANRIIWQELLIGKAINIFKS